ncbi:MAG: hypothetical protein JO269_11245 [Burkholderiaceae bacterium]|nr:hypothetical protein [Burkholderiaceae bacterium]
MDATPSIVLDAAEPTVNAAGTDFVAIPLLVLNAPEYAELQWGDKQLLIDLYVLFSDCASFTVDLDKPRDYRQPPCAAMNVRLVRLLKSGLLQVVGKLQKKRGRVQRVFAFRHPAAHAYG